MLSFIDCYPLNCFRVLNPGPRLWLYNIATRVRQIENSDCGGRIDQTRKFLKGCLRHSVPEKKRRRTEKSRRNFGPEFFFVSVRMKKNSQQVFFPQQLILFHAKLDREAAFLKEKNCFQATFFHFHFFFLGQRLRRRPKNQEGAGLKPIRWQMSSC